MYYQKIKEIFEREALNEARPTNTFGFANALKKHPMVEKIVELRSMSDGVVVMARTKDGQAYEIQIRPMQYAKELEVPKKKS